tara:strand:+ start:3613 stop:3828 length:216 start_codon:yes stop_codon:yes gene_type:complete
MSQHLIREIQNLKQELSLLKEALGIGPGYGNEPGQVDIGKVVDNHEKRISNLEAKALARFEDEFGTDGLRK